MATTEQMVLLLIRALHEPLQRKQTIAQFQTLVWETSSNELPIAVRDVLADLAHDLSYFEADRGVRAEDPTYYGHNRLEAEIHRALARLRNLGVTVPG